MVAGTVFKKGQTIFTGIKLILQDILYKVGITLSSKGNTVLKRKVCRLTQEKVTAGSLFIAVKGAAAD